MDKITPNDVSVTVIQPSGTLKVATLEVATVYRSFRVSRRYIGYTEAEAIRDFIRQFNTNRNA